MDTLQKCYCSEIKNMTMGEIYSSGYTDIHTEFLWKNYWDIGNVEGQVKTGRVTFKWMFGNGMSVQ